MDFQRAICYYMPHGFRLHCNVLTVRDQFLSNFSLSVDNFKVRCVATACISFSLSFPVSFILFALPSSLPALPAKAVSTFH